jgi:hypothetical protein
MQANQSAFRNHKKEKIDALRNAVLNSCLPGAPEDDIQMIFLNYIDELTPWHLRIMNLFDDPSRWAEENNTNFPESWLSGREAGFFDSMKGGEQNDEAAYWIVVVY